MKSCRWTSVSDPGSNGEQMQSLDYSGLSSLNTSEVSFKPHPSSKTYNKTSTTADRQAALLTRDMTQGESGPNEIPDTGLFELRQRTKDNPEVRERLDEEEML